MRDRGGGTFCQRGVTSDLKSGGGGGGRRGAEEILLLVSLSFLGNISGGLKPYVNLIWGRRG